MPFLKQIHKLKPSLTLLLCSLAIGCGPSEQRPELFPAHGSLLINGKPAAGAFVIFYPTDNRSFDERGTRPKATVREDGSFEVTTYQAGDGIPLGDYELGVMWIDDPESSNATDRLQGRFADPKRSDLRASILPRDNALDPIELDRVSVSKRSASRGLDSRDPDQVD